MLTTHHNSTVPPRQLPKRHPLPWLIIAALLLAFVIVSGTAEVVLRLWAPHNSIYPHSVLAMYAAKYEVWDGIPLPPINQPALAEQLRERLGRYHKGLGLDTPPVEEAPPLAPTFTPTPAPTELPALIESPSATARSRLTASGLVLIRTSKVHGTSER